MEMKKNRIKEDFYDNIVHYLDYVIGYIGREGWLNEHFNEYKPTEVMYFMKDKKITFEESEKLEMLKESRRIISKSNLPKTIEDLRSDIPNIIFEDENQLTYFPIFFNSKESHVVNRLKQRVVDINKKISEEKIIRIFIESIFKVIKEHIEFMERERNVDIISKFDEIGVIVCDKKTGERMFMYPIGINLYGKPKSSITKDKKSVIESVINYYGRDKFVELSEKYFIPQFKRRLNSKYFYYDLGDETTQKLIQHYFGDIELEDPELFDRMIVYFNNSYIIPTILRNDMEYRPRSSKYKMVRVNEIFESEQLKGNKVIDLHHVNDIDFVIDVYSDFIFSYVDELLFNETKKGEIFDLLDTTMVSECSNDRVKKSEIKILNNSTILTAYWKIKKLVTSESGIVDDEKTEIEIKNVTLSSFIEEKLKVLIVPVEI